MQTKRLFATTSFRLASLYAALMVGAFAATGAIAWFATRDTSRRELEQRIDAEVAALTHEFSAEGLEAAALAITSRTERVGALEYRLSDPAGRLRVGDLPSATRFGWFIRKTGREEEGSEEKERLLVFTARLSDGSALSVGGDLAAGDHIRRVVLSIIAWTGLAALGVGLTASVFVTRRSLRRIDQIIGVARSVASGRLDARAPLRLNSPPDDVDELGGALNAMLDRIEALVASVRQVSTDVAHDLRTPLSHVRQRLDVLREQGLTDVRRYELVDSIDARIDDIVRTFDAMLRLAELDSAREPLRPMVIDLADVAERVADAFRLDIEGGGRQLETSFDPASVRVDPELISQLIANLIENSVRHTPQGTRIKITTSRDDDGAVLTVQDDGPGIPPTEREAVTQRFYRLEQSRTSPGSGLGLSIVAAIARMHHAGLDLDDACPGLRVRVTFGAPTMVTRSHATGGTGS